MGLDAQAAYRAQVEEAKAARGAVLLEIVCPECANVVGRVVETPVGPLYEATFEGSTTQTPQYVLIMTMRSDRPDDESLRSECSEHGRLILSDAISRDAVRQRVPRIPAERAR
jgi:hypothetical protein